MKINIKKVQRELINDISVPTEVHLVNDDYFGTFDGEDNFNYKITNNGELYYRNHRITQIKHKPKKTLTEEEIEIKEALKKIDEKREKEDTPLLSSEKEYGYEPIKLTIEDLPFLEDIANHWNKIKESFVKVISSGQAMIGHISTSYHFPNGTKKIWYSERFRDRYPESLENFLEHVRGKPIDNKFNSEFAEYIEGIPSKQHYKHGRLDYYLEAEHIILEDEQTIQQIGYYTDDLSKVIELLNFIKTNPSNAIERLTGKYDD